MLTTYSEELIFAKTLENLQDTGWQLNQDSVKILFLWYISTHASEKYRNSIDISNKEQWLQWLYDFENRWKSLANGQISTCSGEPSDEFLAQAKNACSTLVKNNRNNGTEAEIKYFTRTVNGKSDEEYSRVVASPVSSDSLSVIPGMLFEVEKIIARRKHGSSYLYLIKWLGYDFTENTWEPVENLAHCAEMLEDFETFWTSLTNSQRDLISSFVSDETNYKACLSRIQRSRSMNINRAVVANACHVRDTSLYSRQSATRTVSVSLADSATVVNRPVTRRPITIATAAERVIITPNVSLVQIVSSNNRVGSSSLQTSPTICIPDVAHQLNIRSNVSNSSSLTTQPNAVISAANNRYTLSVNNSVSAVTTTSTKIAAINAKSRVSVSSTSSQAFVRQKCTPSNEILSSSSVSVNLSPLSPLLSVSKSTSTPAKHVNVEDNFLAQHINLNHSNTNISRNVSESPRIRDTSSKTIHNVRYSNAFEELPDTKFIDQSQIPEHYHSSRQGRRRKMTEKFGQFVSSEKRRFSSYLKYSTSGSTKFIRDTPNECKIKSNLNANSLSNLTETKTYISNSMNNAKEINSSPIITDVLVKPSTLSQSTKPTLEKTRTGFRRTSFMMTSKLPAEFCVNTKFSSSSENNNSINDSTNIVYTNSNTVHSTDSSISLSEAPVITGERAAEHSTDFHMSHGISSSDEEGLSDVDMYPRAMSPSAQVHNVPFEGFPLHSLLHSLHTACSPCSYLQGYSCRPMTHAYLKHSLEQYRRHLSCIMGSSSSCGTKTGSYCANSVKRNHTASITSCASGDHLPTDIADSVSSNSRHTHCSTGTVLSTQMDGRSSSVNSSTINTLSHMIHSVDDTTVSISACQAIDGRSALDTPHVHKSCISPNDPSCHCSVCLPYRVNSPNPVNTLSYNTSFTDSIEESINSSPRKLNNTGLLFDDMEEEEENTTCDKDKFPVIVVFPPIVKSFEGVDRYRSLDLATDWGTIFVTVVPKLRVKCSNGLTAVSNGYTTATSASISQSFSDDHLCSYTVKPLSKTMRKKVGLSDELRMDVLTAVRLADPALIKYVRVCDNLVESPYTAGGAGTPSWLEQRARHYMRPVEEYLPASSRFTAATGPHVTRSSNTVQPATTVAGPVEKRGRGRPRKYPLTEQQRKTVATTNVITNKSTAVTTVHKTNKSVKPPPFVSLAVDLQATSSSDSDNS